MCPTFLRAQTPARGPNVRQAHTTMCTPANIARNVARNAHRPADTRQIPEVTAPDGLAKREDLGRVTGAHRNQSASRHATQLRIATRSTGVHGTAIARLSSAATRALQQHPIRSGTPIGQRRARSRVRHAKMRATRRVSARPSIGVPTTTIVF